MLTRNSPPNVVYFPILCLQDFDATSSNNLQQVLTVSNYGIAAKTIHLYNMTDVAVNAVPQKEPRQRGPHGH